MILEITRFLLWVSAKVHAVFTGEPPYERLTLRITGGLAVSRPVDVMVYAQHGREFKG